MADPVTPAATPAANPAGNNPAPQAGSQPNPAPAPAPQPQPGNQPQPQGQFILSQEQFNQRWGEKMATLETEFGMPIKDVKAFIEANKPKPAPQGEPLKGPELRMAQMEALMLKGIPSKQIPVILDNFNIRGKTREEIDASITALISAGLLKVEDNKPPAAAQQPAPNVAAQGAGNQGVPATQQPKIWKRSEIKKLSTEDYNKNREDIMKAMSEGRIQD